MAAVLVGGLLFWALRQQSQLNEMVEQLEFEKEALQDEYEDLAIQFDGYERVGQTNLLNATTRDDGLVVHIVKRIFN